MFLFGFWLLGGCHRARYLWFPLIPGTWRASKSALTAVSSDSGYLKGVKERAICGSPGFRSLRRPKERAFRVFLRFRLLGGGLTHTPLDLEENMAQAHYRSPFFLVT